MEEKEGVGRQIPSFFFSCGPLVRPPKPRAPALAGMTLNGKGEGVKRLLLTFFFKVVCVSATRADPLPVITGFFRLISHFGTVTQTADWCHCFDRSINMQ